MHLLLNKRGARLKAAPKCAEGSIYAELRIPVEEKATLEVASSEPSALHHQFVERSRLRLPIGRLTGKMVR